MEQEFTDHKVERVIKTCPKHYWVESEKQDDNSNLVSVNCIHCPTGANIDPDKFRVEEGEIIGI